MSTAGKCRTCAQPILFALVKRRDGGTSRMPLNLKPSMAGNIAVTKDVHGTMHGRVLVGDEGARIGETRYQTHFATCVAADVHRAMRGKPERKPKPAPPANQPSLF